MFILEAVNHKIHAEEVEAGLWEKKTGKPKESKSKAKYEVKVDSSILSEPKIEFE